MKSSDLIQKLATIDEQRDNIPSTEKTLLAAYLTLMSVLALRLSEQLKKEAGEQDLQYGLNPAERAELDKPNGYGRIPAIKLFRERTNCSLLEAKNAVEDYLVNTGLAWKNYDNENTWQYKNKV